MDARGRPNLRRGQALLALATVLMLVPAIDAIGLWAPDEPRAAAVAREMFTMQHGPAGLVLLHLNREAYTEKPPLYYWLVSAVSLAPGEVTEWSARLPSMLAGIATIALTVVFGARLVGMRAALLGAALLLTTFKFSHYARRVQFDVVLTVFELAAVYAFWRLDRGLGAAGRNRLAAHAFMSLALLTKGPVGFLIPVLTMAAYFGVERRLRDLRRLFTPGALAVSLGPILAWLVAAVALAPPGFFGETVGGGLISRYFAGTSHARPFYYFLYQFPIEFLPWCLLWPAVAWAGRRRVFVDGADPERRRAWRFLLAWVGASFVFFSISAGKRGIYMVPCFPAAALLCADALEALLAGRARPPRALTVGAALAAAALVGVAVGFARADEVAGAELPHAFLLLVAGAPLLAAAAWWIVARRGPARRVAWVAVGCAFCIEVGVFQILYPALDDVRSMKRVATAALRWLPPGERIALLGSESMVGGLQYYAERPVIFIDDVEDLPAYFAEGGRAVVMKTRKLERVREHTEVTVLDRLREGDRELVIVRSSDAKRGVSHGAMGRGPAHAVQTFPPR